jgi:hypothetical protein
LSQSLQTSRRRVQHKFNAWPIVEPINQRKSIDVSDGSDTHFRNKIIDAESRSRREEKKLFLLCVPASLRQNYGVMRNRSLLFHSDIENFRFHLQPLKIDPARSGRHETDFTARADLVLHINNQLIVHVSLELI